MQTLPENFVYLKDIDSTIVQEVRYAGHHNFVGSPIPGYEENAAIMTRPTALALAAVQNELKSFSLGLKVYDAYRPQQAVDAFYAWSQDHKSQRMKAEFYPLMDKEDIFKRGYLVQHSGHSRGSTVDVTIVPLPVPEQPLWTPGDTVLDGRLPYGERFFDNSIDMGTSFDCLDDLSHTFNASLPPHVRANRMLLRGLMENNGFRGITCEWWHFTLRHEPFPGTYFDFPVR